MTAIGLTILLLAVAMSLGFFKPRTSPRWFGRLIRWIEREREVELKPGHSISLGKGDTLTIEGKTYQGPCRVSRTLNGEVVAYWYSHEVEP